MKNPREVIKIRKTKSRKMKSLTPNPPPNPTRTSPPRWRGSGHRDPVSAPASNREGSGSLLLGVGDLATPAPLIHWQPHGTYQHLTLHLSCGAVGPAPTPTAACCLTARCASTHTLLLLLSQVQFHFATRLYKLHAPAKAKKHILLLSFCVDNDFIEMGKGDNAGYIYIDHTGLGIAPIKSIKKTCWLLVDHLQHKFFCSFIWYNIQLH